MSKRPKIVVVGDELLPPEKIKKNLISLQELGWDITTCWFGPKDLGELDQELAKLEHFGPDAVDEPQELHKHLTDADVLLVHICPVSSRLLKQYPNLVAVGVLRGGTENVDIQAAEKLKIPVFHTIGRTSEGVSDFTIGLILSELRNIARSHSEVKKGGWPKEFPNSGNTPEMRELKIGLIGFGEIGQLVAKKLTGFGSEIQVYDPYQPELFIEKSGAKAVSLDQLVRTSDVITLHARHKQGEPHILGKAELEVLKPHAYVINTARAGLIDMDSLIAILQEGKIMGAAIDVFETEPIGKDHPLLKLSNVTLTSHIAFDTASFYERSPILWLNGIEDAIISGDNRTCLNYSENLHEKLSKLKELWTFNPSHVES
jgi:D-3-phosphoglycerate dehydrogenase / 2-oxoglutarate reductase